MSSSDEIKKQLDLSNDYLSGKKICGVKFRHNSLVCFVDVHGTKVEGWIVSVCPTEPEPIYSVERCDGYGDEEVAETKIELLLDPHEK